MDPGKDGEPVPQPDIECTYNFCTLKFFSEKDMKRHKQNADLHYYCKKCDLDFDTDIAFIMHRVITKKKHITCPECGKDFRSRVGLDDHVELMHPRRQDIKCIACGKRLAKAALMLKHVEDGQCKITPSQFHQERAERAVAKEAFLERYNQDSGSHVSVPTDNHTWPLDNENQSGKTPQQTAEPASGLFSMDEMADKLAEADLNAQPHWNQPLASTPLSQTQTPYSSSQFSSAPAQSQGTFKMSDYWCPQRQVFVCPGAKCGHNFKTTGDFHAHLTGPAHAGGQVSCRSCLKSFRSTYALICHMEAPSRKCQIRHSTHYTQILRELTAGLIGTGGHFGDGTVKYIMPEDEGWQ